MSSAARASSAFSTAHKAYVQSLYRRYLRNALDWNIRRDAWRQEAIEIRAAFERNRNIRNPRELARVLQEAEDNLKRIAHPDPHRRGCHRARPRVCSLLTVLASLCSLCSTHVRGRHKMVRPLLRWCASGSADPPCSPSRDLSFTGSETSL